jgi:hypothetical protein
MLLALYACTNNNHKTTRYQDPIAKRTSAKNVPASGLTSSPTFPVGKGFPWAQFFLSMHTFVFFNQWWRDNERKLELNHLKINFTPGKDALAHMGSRSIALLFL